MRRRGRPGTPFRKVPTGYRRRPRRRLEPTAANRRPDDQTFAARAQILSAARRIDLLPPPTRVMNAMTAAGGKKENKTLFIAMLLDGQ